MSAPSATPCASPENQPGFKVGVAGLALNANPNGYIRALAPEAETVRSTEPLTRALPPKTARQTRWLCVMVVCSSASSMKIEMEVGLYWVLSGYGVESMCGIWLVMANPDGRAAPPHRASARAGVATPSTPAITVPVRTAVRIPAPRRRRCPPPLRPRRATRAPVPPSRAAAAGSAAQGTPT